MRRMCYGNKDKIEKKEKKKPHRAPAQLVSFAPLPLPIILSSREI